MVSAGRDLNVRSSTISTQSAPAEPDQPVAGRRLVRFRSGGDPVLAAAGRDISLQGAQEW